MDAALINARGKAIRKAVAREVVCDADGVFDGLRSRCAVPDDADPIDAKQGSAAIFFEVADGLQIAECVLSKERAGFPEGVFEQGFPEPMGDGGCNAFGRLENKIAGKSVANDDVGAHIKEIVPFDVSDEIDRHFGKKLEGFLCEGVAFGIFAADGDESDARAFDVLMHLAVDFAHQSELRELERRAIGVGSGVDKDELPSDGRHEGRDRGTINAFENTHANLGRRDGRARVPGRNDGVDFAGRRQRGADRDGCMLFCANGRRGGLSHFDDFLGMDETKSGRFAQVILLQIVGKLFKMTDERDPDVVVKFAQGVGDGFHNNGGRVISAHGIDSDPHGANLILRRP